MNMPALTAEASLYKTNRYYRAGRYTIDSSAQTGSPVWPALREQEGEIIEVHGCPPGWTDYGGTCFPPPVTEPPTGGDDWPTGDGPTDGGYKGGGGGTPGHVCNKSDEGQAVADQTCKAYGKRKGISNVYAWCKPVSGGGTAKYCCWNKPDGTFGCVPVTTAMQGT
jgi:hypothetical protein